MSRNWSYLTNPFIAATENSYRTMKKISEFTYFALEKQIPPPSIAAGKPVPSTPALATLTPDDASFYAEQRNALRPLIEEYNNRYVTWLSSYADRKSHTSLLTDLFNKLRSEKIKEWDVAIQMVYTQKSPAYKRLLPNRRIPFQQGPQGKRLDALELLSVQIAGDTNFDDDFKLEISDFHTQLRTEFNNQVGEKSDTTLASHDLEPARLALANGLYASLGAMINHFNARPDKIASFFDLEAIRSSEQTTYRHKVKALGSVNALIHTFHEEDTIRLVNDGKTQLIFWLATKLKEAPGETKVTVESFSEKLVAAADLGNLNNRFLNVSNPNEFTEGHYVITLM